MLFAWIVSTCNFATLPRFQNALFLVSLSWSVQCSGDSVCISVVVSVVVSVVLVVVVLVVVVVVVVVNFKSIHRVKIQHFVFSKGAHLFHRIENMAKTDCESSNNH